MRVTRALLIAAFSLRLAACEDALVDELSGPRPAPRACTVDADCAGDRSEVCRASDGSGTPSATSEGPTWGICVIPSTGGAGEVFLEVRPLDTTQPVSPFGPVSLADGQNQMLTVPAPLKVSGMVTYHGEGEPEPVRRAKVKLRLDSPVPGRPVRYETFSDPDGSVLPGHFELLVPPGSYDVLVTPPRTAAGVLPPTERIFEGRIDAAALAERPAMLVVSAPSELVPFEGRATYLQGGLVRPGAELLAWAIDADTLSPEGTGPQGLGGMSIAQPVETDADGSFRLWLPRLRETRDRGDRRVRLQFGPASAATPFPTFVDPTTYVVSAGGVEPAPSAPMATIEVPVKVRGRVRARRADGGLEGLAGARVTFRTVDRASFSYSVTVIADEDGRYEASLFPEVYAALAVAPPESSASQAICPPSGGAGELMASKALEGYDFRCETRVALFGLVRDRAVGVEGVAVEAVRRKDALVPEELRQRATTDAAGQFSIALPRGTYDLTLAPPKGTKLPTKLVRGVTLGLQPIDGSAPMRESIVVELDAPFELFGRLFSGDQSRPLAATIEAYAVGKEGGATLVGQTVSADDGSYSLVLPAQSP